METISYSKLVSSSKLIHEDREDESAVRAAFKEVSVYPKRTVYSLYIKRLLDILIALPAVAISLPVNVVLAVCTYFDVGRPILFKQQRPGKDGKLITIVKFRNMTNETDENGELLPPDQRVTRFGKIVRACSLDELLQFWNILFGQMSVIGPRPLLPEYLDRYTPRQNMRHAVRPGLECPTLKRIDHYWTWEEQFENDVWYVENVSLRTDVRMLLRVAQMVFDRTSVSSRSASTRQAFEGSASASKEASGSLYENEAV